MHGLSSHLTPSVYRVPPRMVNKGVTPALRLAGMRLAVAVVEGLNPLDRSAAAVHGEAWKLFERYVKVRGVECALGRSKC